MKMRDPSGGCRLRPKQVFGKSLERRIRRVVPLFADRIIADELAANPKYFNPVDDESL